MISHDRAQELISARMDASLTAGGPPGAAAAPGDVRFLPRFRQPSRRAGAGSAGTAAVGSEPGRSRAVMAAVGPNSCLGLVAAKSPGAVFSWHGRSLRAGARGRIGRHAHYHAECTRP